MANARPATARRTPARRRPPATHGVARRAGAARRGDEVGSRPVARRKCGTADAECGTDGLRSQASSPSSPAAARAWAASWRASSRAEGCHVAICDVSDDEHGRDAAALRARTRRAGTRVSHRSSPTSRTRRRCSRSATHVAREHAHRPRRPAVQQRRHRRRRQLRRRRPRRVGARPSPSAGAASTYGTRAVPAAAARERGRATSSTRAASTGSGRRSARHAAHRVQRGEVRGEGLHRGADHRPPASTRRTCGSSVVMPGHIGTSIVLNSGAYLGRDPKELTDEQVAELRERCGRRASTWPTAIATRTCATLMQALAEGFRDNAPTTRGRGGDDHPRRRARRGVADPGRRRRRRPRRGRARATRPRPTSPTSSSASAVGHLRQHASRPAGCGH